MTTPAASLFDTVDILPPDPVDASGAPLAVIHDREYRVRAFRRSPDIVLIRGAIRDQKPPGQFFPGDPDPLTVHHMQIDIEVAYPSFEIVSAGVGMNVHPHGQCPNILSHYDELVGLSIARGFTHKVRELFGGPRGCTHTTALLQAMAPVAIQVIFSMRPPGADDGAEVASTRQAPTTDQRRAMWSLNLNTCHVWAEDSAFVRALDAGGQPEFPIWAERRMVELGIKPEDWRPGAGG